MGLARVVQSTRAIVIDANLLRDLFSEDHDLERVFMGRTAEIINERVKATWLQLAKSFAS